MSSSAEESVCRSIRELKRRLDKIKQKWAIQTVAERSNWRRFCDEWQSGWQEIVSRLREIDEMLNRQVTLWQGENPAILQFQPK